MFTVESGVNKKNTQYFLRKCILEVILSKANLS